MKSHAAAVRGEAVAHVDVTESEIGSVAHVKDAAEPLSIQNRSHLGRDDVDVDSVDDQRGAIELEGRAGPQVDEDAR